MKPEYVVLGQDRAAYANTQPQPEFRVSLTLAISDTRALWTAAAARLLAVPGTTLEEVIEVIGPSEDPSPHDCLAALTKPDVLPGCVLADFWIDGLPETKARHEPVRSAVERRVIAAERPVKSISARTEVAPGLRISLSDGSPHQRQVN